MAHESPRPSDDTDLKLRRSQRYSASAATSGPGDPLPAWEAINGAQSSPSAPSTTLSGKRTASEASVEGTRRSVHTLPSISTATTQLADSPSQICLCQPDPKIPRPRNAFILYRQHHQARVVANHPGLANPEISKIIGDQWRQSSLEVKNHWKILADEEKLRHHRLYPDYRYQPRRNGRPSVSTTNTADSPRCGKCGGKGMTAPTGGLPTPATPAATFSHTAHAALAANAQLRFPRHPLTNADPQTPRPYLAGPYGHYPETPRSVHLTSPDYADPKRRKYAHGTYGSGNDTPFPFRRRESLPRPDFMPSTHFTMGAPPPPRPRHPTSSPSAASLTLPPLQSPTAGLASPTTRSLTAMVSSIPLLSKIKVLARISPPLAAPSPASPPHPMRGLIIAVDGAPDAAIHQLTSYLADALRSTPTPGAPIPRVRVWMAPTFATHAARPSFSSYLQLVTQWHEMAREVVAFITTPPRPPSPAPLSPKTRRPSSGPPAADMEHAASDASVAAASSDRYLPVAILPRYQLTLTDAAASLIPIADAYAPVDHWQWMATLWRGIVGPDVTIAVRGAETMGSPGGAVGAGAGAGAGVGTSGAGSVPPGAGSAGGSVSTGPPANSGAGAGTSTNANAAAAAAGASGSVEVRLSDARAVLVGVGEGGRVSESALRRVGFEFGEWLRGWEARGREA